MSQEFGYESTSISTEPIETVIGVKTVFKGNVSTTTPISIDGVFEGEIETDNVIIVSKTGSLKGNVTCKEMQLYGHACGTLNCSYLLSIKAGAVYEGDVTTRNLETVLDSVLDGTCTMLKPRQE